MTDIIFVAGKKRAGKDFVCDTLVQQAGFTKYHIVRPWLEEFCRRHGITYDQYERNKADWREVVQAEATEARKADPDVLIRAFKEALPTLPRPLCVTAVRFPNEIALGREVGALTVRVECPDDVRQQRFIDSGESLYHFNDPFEQPIDTLDVHASIAGTLTPKEIIEILEWLGSWKHSRERKYLRSMELHQVAEVFKVAEAFKVI